MTEYIAWEDVRDPNLRVVTVATAKVPESDRWHTIVRHDGFRSVSFGNHSDPVSAFAGHRAICRAVRLGHPLNEEAL